VELFFAIPEDHPAGDIAHNVTISGFPLDGTSSFLFNSMVIREAIIDVEPSVLHQVSSLLGIVS
jgi:hypothetical protein